MIVGICGNAGSGKDTAADILIARHGFVRVAFADPMKRFVRDLYGWSDEQLWGPSEFRNAPDPNDRRRSNGEPLTPRHALQQLGTEWGRECCPDTWIDYAILVADKLGRGGYSYSPREGLVAPAGRCHMAPCDVVISDCRFRNEYLKLKRVGAKVVRIHRAHAFICGENHHVSETELNTIPMNEFNWFLDNSGTLEALEKNVDFFVQQCVRVPG
jgi:hypothetical protein